MCEQRPSPASPGEVIADTFRVMGRIEDVVERMMDDPELAARLYQLGKTVGQELQAKFAEQHNLRWISKKARDTVYARTAAIVMQGLNESLGLPGDHYD
jgi:hypothetical protein